MTKLTLSAALVLAASLSARGAQGAPGALGAQGAQGAQGAGGPATPTSGASAARAGGAPGGRAGDASARVADAAEQQDGPRVAALVAQGADVNAAQPDGATALHWAVHFDLPPTVDLLLRRGARVDAVNDHGVTPLALACENGNVALINRLLAAGANPNLPTDTGITPLMSAARAGASEAVKALIARGAAVNARETSHQQTALMWAVAQKHVAVVQVLVENGADVGARTPARHRTIQTGNRYGDQNSIKGSVSETDLGGFSPLLFAARNGDADSARVLLTAGAPVDDTAANGATALIVAAHSGHHDVAELLLAQGANPNADGPGYTPLHAAVLRGDLALVQSLLGRGAKPDPRLVRGTSSRYYSKDYAFNDTLIGATPLLLAARYGEPEMMRALAAAGADPTVTLPDGSTMIMTALAVTRGYGAFRAGDRRERYQGPADVAAKVDGEEEQVTFAVVKLALSLGVDPKVANRSGDTAMHQAASQSVDSVIPLLAEAGAPLEPRNARGQTPLSITAVGARFGLYAMDEASRTATAAVLRKLGAKE